MDGTDAKFKKCIIVLDQVTCRYILASLSTIYFLHFSYSLFLLREYTATLFSARIAVFLSGAVQAASVLYFLP